MKPDNNNFTWEGYLNSLKTGEVVFITPRWRHDGWRTAIFRMSHKGYFKRVTARERKKGNPYGDYLERTSKKFIPGDGPKKPIAYSFPNTQQT